MDRPPCLPLSLRAHRAVFPNESLVERDAGFWRVCTPSNPTFFWGNFLHFDAPPRAADCTRWPALFEAGIAQAQPAARHRAFSWEGAESGAILEFNDLGYEFLDSVIMGTERLVPARRPSIDTTIRAIASDADWTALVDFRVATRDRKFSADGYRAYSIAKVAHWRRYVDAGSGVWMAAFVGDAIAAALGLFAEPGPGADGSRLARYQDVATDVRWQRRGLCSALLVAAADALASLAIDRYVIITDAHDIARPIYEQRGFRTVARWLGLQRMPDG